MNTDAYLKRIHFESTPTINVSTFIKLHESHVTNVPFENLDIQHKKEIKLEQEHLFKKIVRNTRGGFCYELNYLFYHLLLNLGFKTTIISVQIFDNEIPGPEFDHLALIIKLNGNNWLADVGFGDLFVKPLNIATTDIQYDGRNYFKIKNLDEKSFLLSMSKNGIDFEKKYTFQIDEKKIEQFTEQCLLKQQSLSSYFVKNKVVTLPFSNGRKTIFNSRYIVKTNGIKTEFKIENKKEEITILKKEFNITL